MHDDLHLTVLWHTDLEGKRIAFDGLGEDRENQFIQDLLRNAWHTAEGLVKRNHHAIAAFVHLQFF